jgi:hypothetical protein
VAAYPYGEQQRTARERERTAIAFAAIQLLATHADPSLLYVWSLCPELRDRVVGVRDIHSRYIAPDFTPTEELLRLPPGSVRLDNASPVVQEHKTTFPGYFVDNEDAARFFARLLGGDLISVADLRPAVVRLVAREWRANRDSPLLAELLDLIGTPEQRRLVEILTAPRMFKYLSAFVSGDLHLSRMSGAELRQRFLAETGDGPFSATVRLAEWAASARAVLEAAEEKYGHDPADRSHSPRGSG